MAKRPKPNNVEHAMVRALDDLASFDEFQSEIAPALRASVKAGKSPEEIYKIVMSYSAARMASIALTSKSPKEAITALRDILDRTGGKPTEKREVKLALEHAPDEQIDARLKTLMLEQPTDDEE